jgi:hypothetical protein
MQQTEVIQNNEGEHVRSLEQGEGRHKKYKTLQLGDAQVYDRSSD